MTCIVGYIDRQKRTIYMGGDSAGVAGLQLRIRKDPKVFIRKPFIIGYTSSFRMGQLLMADERFNIRRQKDQESDYEYMVSAFIPAIQKLFKDGGYLSVEKDVLSGGTFLVGYKDNLYEIEEDFQVAQYNEEYASCGCGANYALGSLYSSSGGIVERINQALQCAAYYSAGVRRPFKIIKMEY